LKLSTKWIHEAFSHFSGLSFKCFEWNKFTDLLLVILLLYKYIFLIIFIHLEVHASPKYFLNTIISYLPNLWVFFSLPVNANDFLIMLKVLFAYVGPPHKYMFPCSQTSPSSASSSFFIFLPTVISFLRPCYLSGGCIIAYYQRFTLTFCAFLMTSFGPKIKKSTVFLSQCLTVCCLPRLPMEGRLYRLYRGSSRR